MPQGQPTTVPDDGLTTRVRRNAPLLAVHTGAGKGKSTAAFGMALRAWNQGFSIAVFQFVKSAKWKVGEEAAFGQLGRLHDEHGVGGPVEWHKMGAGWSWSRKHGDEDDHAAAAADGWAEITRRLAEERHDFYVLDEFTYPLKWGWVDVDEVIAVLTSRPGTQHVVITGRDAPQALARHRRPRHRDDEGQTPDGCRSQGPKGHRVVTTFPRADVTSWRACVFEADMPHISRTLRTLAGDSTEQYVGPRRSQRLHASHREPARTRVSGRCVALKHARPRLACGPTRELREVT